jgi:quinol monooxygenase YgiN
VKKTEYKCQDSESNSNKLEVVEVNKVVITINIYYTGENGSARKFAKEMISSGVVSDIRAEDGNIRYDYFCPMNDAETVLLIDSWKNQKAIDIHMLPL